MSLSKKTQPLQQCLWTPVLPADMLSFLYLYLNIPMHQTTQLHLLHQHSLRLQPMHTDATDSPTPACAPNPVSLSYLPKIMSSPKGSTHPLTSVTPLHLSHPMSSTSDMGTLMAFPLSPTPTPKPPSSNTGFITWN